MRITFPKIPLKRIDFSTERGGLPPSLIAAIEADGGLWSAGDAYTTTDEVVETAHRVKATALRLDFRDLSFLKALPEIRYLHIRSDARPRLDPVLTLSKLKALIIETSGLRGEINPKYFPELRWLRIGLGGKGGAAILPSIKQGHPQLEWLAVSETREHKAIDLCAEYPKLRSLHIGLADYLRELGNLAEVTPNLKNISIYLTQIRSLNGLCGLHNLETLNIQGGHFTSIEPLQSFEKLCYLQLEVANLTSIEPLRNHKSIRMVAFNKTSDSDLSVLASIPGLVAVRCTRGFEKPIPWPQINMLSEDDPLRIEWYTAIRE
jgi:hypothetical protein